LLNLLLARYLLSTNIANYDAAVQVSAATETVVLATEQSSIVIL